MGMFDDVRVSFKCPRCGTLTFTDAQTYDLGRGLCHYAALDEKWETWRFGKEFRAGLPVFPRFPLDKSAKVWASQAEHTEAAATVEKELGDKLRYVSLALTCRECKADLTGRLEIRGGMLRLPVLFDEAEVDKAEG